MKLFANRLAFARIFGGGVISQGLLREQRQVAAIVAVAALLVCCLVWLGGGVRPEAGVLLHAELTRPGDLPVPS